MNSLPCPICKNNLEEHSNEHLQQCVLDLPSIIRKNITIDGGDSKNFITKYFKGRCDSDDKSLLISIEVLTQQ